jgi:hypothetical protein
MQWCSPNTAIRTEDETIPHLERPSYNLGMTRERAGSGRSGLAIQILTGCRSAADRPEAACDPIPDIGCLNLVCQMQTFVTGDSQSNYTGSTSHEVIAATDAN